jgi:VCBS repeat-containing protein
MAASTILNGFPTYGNWGGPGWSGGQENLPNAPITPSQLSVAPIDGLDALFKEHDIGYDKADRAGSDLEQAQAILTADLELLGGMSTLNPDALDYVGQEYRSRAIELFQEKVYLDFFDIARSKIFHKSRQRTREPAKSPTRRDPLVLDLDGDGIETTNINGGSAFFDQDNNNFAEKTGWLKGDDAFLAWDRNGNGSIDSGNELFGDQTVLRSGTKATSGYQALSEWDSNKDGVIDSSDAHFADLKVWRDLNQDGVSQTNELQTLTEAGIASLSLNAAAPSATDPNAIANAQVGNPLSRLSSFTRTDGTTGVSAEALLQRDTALTIAKTTYTVSTAIATDPNLEGYGTLLDLHQSLAKESAAGSTPLATALNSFLVLNTSADPTSTNYIADLTTRTAARNTALNNLLYTWADAGGVAANSRGNAIDARKVMVLEAAFGQSLGNPDSNSAIQLERSYRDLAEYYHGSLLAQTELKDLYDQIQYRWDDASQSLKGDLTQVEASIQQQIAADPVKGTQLLADFARSIKGLGAEEAVNYLAFREDFFEQDQLAGRVGSTALTWAMDTAGRQIYDRRGQGTRAWSPHVEGTDGSEAVHGSLTEGDGYINSLYGDDVIWGTTRNEGLINEVGDSFLYGAEGNDVLYAGEGDDTLDGGTGNDTLQGEAGNDTFIFRKGGGVDRVIDWNTGDKVWIAASAADIKLRRNGTDLIVKFADTGDSLTISGYLSRQSGGPDGVVLQFRDGSTWNANTILESFLPRAPSDGIDLLFGTAGADTLNGLGGNDQIAGNGGDDTITGGTGDDQLFGAADFSPYSDNFIARTGANGNDTYIYNRGDGNDTIADLDNTVGNTDTIRFGVGITPDDLAFSFDRLQSIPDLKITIAGGGGLTIKNFLDPIGHAVGNIERFEFADGTVLTDIDIRTRLFTGTDGDDRIQVFGDVKQLDGKAGNDNLSGGLNNDTLIGGSGNDYLFGAAGDDALEGGEGIDQLYGFSGDDHLDGGDGIDMLDGSTGSDVLLGGGGDDTLTGGLGNDVLDGGAGNDRLFGGDQVNPVWINFASYAANGNDSYTFKRGYGHDIIVDRDRTTGNVDEVELGNDIAPDNVQLIHSGDNLVLVLDSGESLTVSNYFKDGAAEWQVERIQFADGTTWDVDEIRDRVLAGSAGNDLIFGFDGRDDAIQGLGGNDVVYARSGNDVVDGGAGNDTLRGEAGNDTLLGGSGNDLLEGGIGADVLDGGAGDDTLVGGEQWVNPFMFSAGDDTYRFGFGDGHDTVIENDDGVDRVSFKSGVTADSVAVRYKGDDLMLTLTSGDSLTLRNWLSYDESLRVEYVNFADGTQWDVAELRRRALIGGNGNDVLTGFYGAETLRGGKGADLLTSVGVNNVFEFSAGDGVDTVESTAFLDTIRFSDVLPGDVSVRRNGDDLLLAFGSGDEVTVKRWFTQVLYTPVDGVRRITFADGSEWSVETVKALALEGTNRGETLRGYYSNDTLQGLRGDDTLEAGFGDDRYVFAQGDGHDVVTELGGNDTLVFSGLTAGDVTLNADGLDLLITSNGGADSVRVTGWYADTAHRVEHIEFSNGTVWNEAQIRAAAITISDNNDYIVGTPDADAFDGQGGDDTLIGLEGDDTLLGGTGRDTLYGDDGSDTLNGGKSDDVLFTGTGYNTIYFNAGDGIDTLRIMSSPDVYGGYLYYDTNEARRELVDMENYAPGSIYQNDHWLDWVANNSGALAAELESRLIALDAGVMVEEAKDTVSDFLAWAAPENTLVLGPGITEDQLTVQYQSGGFSESNEGQSGAMLAIGIGQDDGVVVQAIDDGINEDSNLNGAPNLTRVRLADGTELSLEDLVDRADGVIGYQNGNGELHGSLFADQIYGGIGADRIDARQGDDLINSGDGDDVVAGGGGNDEIVTGEGASVIAGQHGDDLISGLSANGGGNVYAYNLGDGSDVINLSEGDTLSFGPGINPEDITAYFNANHNLVLKVGTGSDDTITLNNRGIAWVQFIYASGDVRAYSFNGAEGSPDVWDTVDDAGSDAGNPFAIFADTDSFDWTAGWNGGERAMAYARTGNLFGVAPPPVEFDTGDGDDVIEGTNGADVIFAGEGNNVIHSGGGRDEIYAGSGNDVIDAGDGLNYVQAGDGNNVIRSGKGSDSVTSGAGNDVINLGDGDNNVNAGTGDDIVIGGDGWDTYEFNAGEHLTIEDQATDKGSNRLFLGMIEPNFVDLSVDGNHLVVNLGDGGEVRLSNFDPANPLGDHAVEWIDYYTTVTNADGSITSVWHDDNYADFVSKFGLYLEGTEGADLLQGTWGNDTILGLGGDDVILGSDGDDVLDGGSGNDTYVVNLDGGFDTIIDDASEFAPNVVQFGPGITADDLDMAIEDGGLTVFAGNGAGLRFENFNPADSNGPHAVDTFRFDDGSTLSWAELMVRGFGFYGSDANDEIIGSDQGDFINGFAGNDTLSGGAGDDTYEFTVGDANDTIIDIAQPDQGNALLLHGIDPTDVYLELRDGTLSLLTGTDESIALSGFDPADPYGPHAVESFVFDDGTVLSYADLVNRGISIHGTIADDLISGTATHDVIVGDDGNDSIAGGKGGDLLIGGNGDDTYVFNRGDGVVTIEDDALPGEGNTLEFGQGIALTDMKNSLHFIAPTGSDPGWFIIRLGDTGDEIRIKGFDTQDVESGSHGVESFRFADGTVLSYRQMVQNTFVVQGDVGDDELSGTTLADRLYGYEADDVLSGNDGDDVLTGGIGNDVLSGDTGDDAYIFDLGSGNDTVYDSASAGADNRLVFGAGITPEDLRFELGSDGLLIRYSASDSVLLADYQTGIDTVISQIEFANGQIISLAESMSVAPLVIGAMADETAPEDEYFSWQMPGDVFASADGPLTFTATLADGSDLPEWLSFNPSFNTLSGTPDGPDIGEVNVRIYASSVYGKTSSQTFSISVPGVNDAPLVGQIIGDQAATEDATFTFALPTGVFTDQDNGDVLSYSVSLENGDPLPSWMTFDAENKTFSGTPGNADVGNLHLKVTATDLAGAIASQVFGVAVANTNDTPIALDDLVSVSEDSTLAADAAHGVLVNDSDVDAGDSKTVTSVSVGGNAGTVGTVLNGVYGSLTLNSDGSYTYVANSAAAEALSAGQYGNDVFSYTVADAGGASSSALLTVVVSGINDATIVVADSNVASEDGVLHAAGNVLANDHDADSGDTLSVADMGLRQGTYGTLTLNANGDYDYALNNASTAVQSLVAGQVVVDHFTYLASDGTASTQADIFINVAGTNDAPVAVADAVIAVEAGGISNGNAGSNPTGNVLSNDSDVDQGDVRTVSALTFGAAAGTVGSGLAGNYGALTLNSDGNYSYVVDNANAAVQSLRTVGNTLTDTFSYSITDAVGAISTANLTVTIQGTNDALVVLNDTASVNENSTLNRTIANGILANDSDVDAGDSKTVTGIKFGATAGAIGSALNGQYGALTLNADGSYSYAANTSAAEALRVGQQVDDVFNYTATDALGASSSASLTITVNGVNDAPIASAPLSNVQARIGETLSVTLPGNAFTDVDAGDTLSYGAKLSNGQPLPSWLTFDPTTQKFSGTPTANGSFTIAVAATDGSNASASQSFTLTVNTPTSPVVAVADTATVSEDTKLLTLGNVLANDTSGNAGASLKVTNPGVVRGSYGVLAILDQGSYGYVLDNRSQAVQSLGEGQTAKDIFNYQVTDGINTATSTLTVTINGRNDAPELVTALRNRAAAKNSTVRWDISGNFADVDMGDKLTFGAKLSNGQALPSWLKFDGKTGVFTGKAPANASGAMDIIVTASDGHGNNSQASDSFRVALGTTQAPPESSDGGHDAGHGGSSSGSGSGYGNDNSQHHEDDDGHPEDGNDNALAAWFDKKGSLDLAGLASYIAQFEAWSEQRRSRDQNDAHVMYSDGDAHTHWQRMTDLLDNHLFGAEDSALGVDLALRQANFGSLADLSMAGSRNVLTGSQFSVGVQAFQTLQGLQEGLAKLG